jgi:diaminobutyrate-2-oxoglutarate transaminase
MAAGEATIDYILENDLDDHAASVGKRLREQLEAIGERFDAVGDVRGRGLMLGVEFVDPSADWEGAGPHAPAPEFAAAVQSACFDRGLIIELGGRGSATGRFLPPLTITAAEVDEVASIFEAAVADVATESTREVVQ